MDILRFFLGVLSIFGILILNASCQNTPDGRGNSTNKADGNAADGRSIFKKNCVACHGADGKLGLNGAKDLTISPLSREERISIITKGKNLMTPFEKLLSPGEIQAVAAYTITLKSSQ